MKYVIGIDVGGSTTKIVGFDENGNLIAPMFVRANDQLTSAYGAFGKFCAENGIGLGDIDCIKMTGVGAAFVKDTLYNIPTTHEVEFPCTARGGLYLSGLSEAIVVSMGTGTALVHAKKDGTFEYLGGTGVGGGMLSGLGKRFLGISKTENLIELAKGGNLKNVDLRVSDITSNDVHPDLCPELTASNFGRIKDGATNADIALGLINMIVETVAMLAVFAARSSGLSDIVLTGNISTMPQCRTIFDSLEGVFGVRFIIPENSEFGTVIGAALA